MARRKADPFRRARRRKRVKLSRADKVREQLLMEAYSGKPNGFYCGFTSTKLGKMDVCVFRAPFAAKRYFDLMTEDAEIEWTDEKTCVTSDGVKIEGDRLREIADYELMPTERDNFKLSDEHYKRAQYIRSEREYVEPPPQDSRRRRSRKGMILAKEVAEQLEMSPKDLRKVLRSIMKKPEHGWAWRTQKEVDEVIDKVREKVDAKTEDADDS